MPTIFHKLPFFAYETTLEVQGETYRVLPLQIIVWVSLTPANILHLDASVPRFPAILDTGFTDSFLIHPQQLARFAGMRSENLGRRLDSLRSHGRVIPLYKANLWLHPNQPQERDRRAERPPFLIELDRGIGVPTDEQIYPRLPLLGARALRSSGLVVTINYAKCLLSLRKPRKFWLFG